MHRTTIRLDDDLVAEAKHAALQAGQTLTAFIETALRESLLRRSTHRGERFVVETFSASLQPGVDLDDSASLLELMESDRYRELNDRRATS